MRVTLSKWGNSLAFRVPKDMAEAAGFQEGAPLELTLEDRALVLRNRAWTLEEMLKDMKGKAWHPLLLDDPPVGTEML